MVRALVICLVTLVMPLQALAHAQLRSAAPSAGAVLDLAPAEVILTFNEAIAPLQARWFAPDGTAQDVAARAQGPNLIVTAPAALAQGTHALSWRVVSDDGHPVGGTHVFSIGFKSGAPEVASDAPVWPAAVARGALTLALILGVGGAVWAMLSQTQAPRVTGWALGAVAPASVALLAAQAMDLAGAGLAALGDPGAWALALGSPFAVTAALAVLAAGLATRAQAGWVYLAWAFAALSFAVAGHAARAEPVALMATLIFAHAVALIFWAGALPGLLVGLRAPGPVPTLKRFSRIAVPMVALLVASGSALAWRQVETLAALTATAYGWLLMAKLAFVAGLLGLAAYHRFSLTPRLASAPDITRPAFVRSLRLEIGGMILVLALTAGFRLTPPPRAIPETRLELHLHGRDSMADIALIPGRPGQNRIEITPFDGAFQPFTPREITLFLSRPADGLERITLQADRGDDGIWRAGPLHLPPGGPLDVVADILITDFRKELIGGEIALLP